MAGGQRGYLRALNAAVEAMQRPKSGRVITIMAKSGVSAVLDEEDVWAASLKWHTHRSGRNYYLCHAFSGDLHVNLHSILLPSRPKAGDGSIDVHHIDGDSLNNCRSNLVYALHSDNVAAGFARRRRHGM